MQAFASIVEQLSQPTTLGVPNSISLEKYLEWQKTYTWDALYGMGFGQSFCNHFDIIDNRLYYERNWQRCDALIKREWLIQH